MYIKLAIFLILHSLSKSVIAEGLVVLMTDFGLYDGAVSAMKGVILNVDQEVRIIDLTHNIEPFNIKEASYRLHQVMEYYPQGTVFVCVIDPGVGTKRKSIVVKLKNGCFFVGPDNGIITHVARTYEVKEVREIDESTNRLTCRNASYQTFQGRDVFAFTGAKLASHKITFEQVGELYEGFVTFEVTEPQVSKNAILGEVMVLDGVYGNIWTNIDVNTAKKANLKMGKTVLLEIYRAGQLIYSSNLKFVETFGEVKAMEPLLYINSVGNLAIALNQGNFAKQFNINSECSIRLTHK
jgi:hypothetical protein